MGKSNGSWQKAGSWQKVRTCLDLPILIFFLLLTLSAVFSIDRKHSFFELLKFIDCVIIYYTVVFRCDNQRDINLCLYLIMGVGFFLSVRGIIQYLGGADRSFWLLITELSGPFDNSNFFAGYLTMVILPGLGVMTAQREVGKKVFLGYILAMMLVAFVLTLSRGGWASMLLGLLGAGIIFAYKVKRDRKEDYRDRLNPKLLITVIILFVIVVGLGVSLLGFQAVYDKTSSLFDQKRKKEIESLNGRLPVWKASIQIIKDYPFTGTGLGTFPLVHTHYMKKMLPSDTYTWNEYLQLCLEAGPLSLATCFWLMSCLVVSSIQTFLQIKSRSKERVLFGLLAGILATAIHCLTAPLLHFMSNTILLATLSGLAMSRYFQEKSRLKEPSYIRDSSF